VSDQPFYVVEWDDRDNTAVLKEMAALRRNQEMIMTAVEDLQAAVAELKAEHATFLANVAAKLQGSDGDDAAVQAVVAEIHAEIDALKAADPVTGTAAAPAAPAGPAAAPAEPVPAEVPAAPGEPAPADPGVPPADPGVPPAA
jgi:septal ring factor EnvC (AmiA/AmiB activator)